MMRLHETQQAELFAPSISRSPLAAMPAPSDSEPGRGAYRARRDAGIARARDHAEADLPGWTESAAAFLAAYSLYIGGAFLIEAARRHSRDRLPQPENPKAWGAATLYAVRKGWIVKVGYAPACSSNGSPKCLFVAAEGIR